MAVGSDPKRELEEKLSVAWYSSSLSGCICFAGKVSLEKLCLG